MDDNLLPIHNCVQTAFENERLAKQISILKKENKYLLEEIEKYKKYVNRDYELHDVAVQVGIHTGYNQDSNAKLHEIHNNLLKRHEKEINLNAVNKVTIDRLKVEIKELENKCKQLEKDKLNLLEKQTNLDFGIKNNLITKLKNYKCKYKRCLSELKCFDEKFFDEIEDIKYYLQESLKLNDHYENLLHIKNGDGRVLNEKFQKLSLFNKDSHNLFINEKRQSVDSFKMRFAPNESISTIKSQASYTSLNNVDNSDTETDGDDDGY